MYTVSLFEVMWKYEWIITNYIVEPLFNGHFGINQILKSIHKVVLFQR